MEFHFEQLVVWQEAMDLVEVIYRLTKLFPEEEKFGLVSQLRRAAVSIPANIAEGKGRRSNKEYAHFLYNARGSLYEVVTLLKLARRLRYLSSETLQQTTELSESIISKLSGLINYLKGK